MKVYRLVRKQTIAATVEELWAFFSNAKNLQAITPSYMNFNITSGELPQSIYPGQVITYKVSPLMNIPMFWMTEITSVVDNKLFVDEQRIGPYKMWHHQHHFEATEGGTIMTDIVHYSLPMGFLGGIAHGLFVKKQLNDIFDYRQRKIDELFPGK